MKRREDVGARVGAPVTSYSKRFQMRRRIVGGQQGAYGGGNLGASNFGGPAKTCCICGGVGHLSVRTAAEQPFPTTGSKRHCKCEGDGTFTYQKKRYTTERRGSDSWTAPPPRCPAPLTKPGEEGSEASSLPMMRWHGVQRQQRMSYVPDSQCSAPPNA